MLLTVNGQQVDVAADADSTLLWVPGWDPQTGRPTSAKLAELGVESAAK